MNITPTPKGSVRMMDLPQIHDPRGDLTFVEGGNYPCGLRAASWPKQGAARTF